MCLSIKFKKSYKKHITSKGFADVLLSVLNTKIFLWNNKISGYVGHSIFSSNSHGFYGHI